jgi:hypothetical protein
MLSHTKKPLFPLGRTVATPGAMAALEAAGSSALLYLSRHAAGDWGDLTQEDKAENELAVKKGWRIFSAYILPKTGQKLWVISEADRSVTTLLLPSEY